MELLPDRLKAAWRDVEAGACTAEDFERRKAEWMAEYRAIWTAALLRDGQSDLQRSLLTEVAEYLRVDDLTEVERRCRAAVQAVAEEWKERVAPGELGSVERWDPLESTCRHASLSIL